MTDCEPPDAVDMHVQHTINVDVGAVDACSAKGSLQPELTIIELLDCMANVHGCMTGDDVLARCVSHIPCAQSTAVMAGCLVKFPMWGCMDLDRWLAAPICTQMMCRSVTMSQHENSPIWDVPGRSHNADSMSC